MTNPSCPRCGNTDPSVLAIRQGESGKQLLGACRRCGLPDTTGEDDNVSWLRLTRLTVNLTPTAIEALDRAVSATGDSRTDTVNRALQVYAHLVEKRTIQQHEGGS